MWRKLLLMYPRFLYINEFRYRRNDLKQEGMLFLQYPLFQSIQLSLISQSYLYLLSSIIHNRKILKFNSIYCLSLHLLDSYHPFFLIKKLFAMPSLPTVLLTFLLHIYKIYFDSFTAASILSIEIPAAFATPSP